MPVEPCAVFTMSIPPRAFMSRRSSGVSKRRVSMVVVIMWLPFCGSGLGGGRSYVSDFRFQGLEDFPNLGACFRVVVQGLHRVQDIVRSRLIFRAFDFHAAMGLGHALALIGIRPAAAGGEEIAGVMLDLLD